MNLLLKGMGVISCILLSCTIICGLWIRTHPQEDMQFHFGLSLTAVLVSLVTIILFMIFKK